MKTVRLLIVDDDPIVRKTYALTLRRLDLEVDEAGSLEELALALHRVTYDVVLLDLTLGTRSGLEGLPLILKEQPYAGVFILTASNSVEQAVESMRRGAAGYLTKDLTHEKLEEELKRFLEQRTKSDANVRNGGLLGFIGESEAIQGLKARMDRVKDIDSTVLILGESGTGKEVIARALHTISNRRSEPFSAVNCGAIPENLLESELFGHKKGAFTDARSDKKGLFEVAASGTILLDEIGDMPILLQTKLLRVLQERHFVPLGSHVPVPLKARVVCATNRDLQQEVISGRFREDLFFRINVVVLQSPSLRSRASDIPMLVRHFLEQCNTRFGRNVQYPNDALIERILAFPWPGNVRELQNSIERGVVLSPDDQLHAEDVFFHFNSPRAGASARADRESISVLPSSLSLDLPLTEARLAFERAYLNHHLRRASGNISDVSRAIGRYRADIYRMLEKHGFNAEEFRGGQESAKETRT
ncbi:MAG: sigma-54-dependent Fis family transcriptional regulator [Silvanigrellales bacterium]|nr:sigma-54-dependent Fis family transcriptional regulator [Silvanigrellales bacterium]